jgi:hypothetical protein
MESGTKITATIILLFLILIGISYFAYFNIRPLLLQTEYPPSIWATIHGNITLTKDFLDSNLPRPENILIYLPTDPSFLCSRGIPLQNIGNINWSSNNITGNYSITFSLPIPAIVYVTPDCEGCNHQQVNIDQNGANKEVDIIWDSQRCPESSISVSNDPQEVITQVDKGFVLLDADATSLYNGFNKTQQDSIESDIGQGKGFISNIALGDTGNQKLVDAYSALWYYWRGLYKEEAFKLNNCVDQIQTIINEHNDSLCYIMEFSSNETFSFHKQSANYLGYLNDNPQNYNTVESLKNSITILSSNYLMTEQLAVNCQTNLDLINRTFNFQTPYCEAKKATFNFFNYVPIVLSILIGTFFGLILESRLHLFTKTKIKLKIMDRKIETWIKDLSIETKGYLIIYFVLIVGSIFTQFYFPQYLGYLFVGFIVAVITHIFKRIEESKKHKK